MGKDSHLIASMMLVVLSSTVLAYMVTVLGNLSSLTAFVLGFMTSWVITSALERIRKSNNPSKEHGTHSGVRPFA